MRRVVERALAAVLLVAVAIYRAVVSPVLVALFGARCRFYPSCSEYAEACVRHYGPFAGSWRALKRLARCHPFHPGGYDPPVPDSRSHG